MAGDIQDSTGKGEVVINDYDGIDDRDKACIGDVDAINSLPKCRD